MKGIKQLFGGVLKQATLGNVGCPFEFPSEPPQRRYPEKRQTHLSLPRGYRARQILGRVTLESPGSHPLVSLETACAFAAGLFPKRGGQPRAIRSMASQGYHGANRSACLCQPPRPTGRPADRPGLALAVATHGLGEISLRSLHLPESTDGCWSARRIGVRGKSR